MPSCFFDEEMGILYPHAACNPGRKERKGTMHLRKIATYCIVAVAVSIGALIVASPTEAAPQKAVQTESAIPLQSYGPDGTCVCPEGKTESCRASDPRTTCCAIWKPDTGCRIFCATACQAF